MGRAGPPLRPATAPATPRPLDVRPAMPGDGEDVAHLLAHLGYPCTPAEALDRIHAVAEDRQQVLLLARREGVACGLMGLHFLYYLPLGALICRITALVVAPEMRGHGTGRHLLEEASRRARQGGCVRLELTTALHRTEAHAFYRACGFSESSLRFTRTLGEA